MAEHACGKNVNIVFHKNKMGSIIRSSGTIFYSLLYLSSRIGFNGLKCLYSVISVIDKRLRGNTKKWTIAPFVDGHSAISPFLGGVQGSLVGGCSSASADVYGPLWIYRALLRICRALLRIYRALLRICRAHW